MRTPKRAITDLTRMTVRARIKEAIEKGFVSHEDDGMRLTNEGVERLKNIFDEFFGQVKVPLVQFNRVLAREHPELLGGKT